MAMQTYSPRQKIKEMRSKAFGRPCTCSRTTAIQKYVLVIILVGVATVLHRLLQPTLGGTQTYILYYPGLVLATLIGGVRSGLLAAALGAFAVSYFFLEPESSLSIADPPDALALALISPSKWLSPPAKWLSPSDWLRAGRPTTGIQKYVLAVLLVGVATVLHRLLEPTFGSTQTYILYYPAVILATLIGGVRSGLLAAALGAFAVSYFFLEPESSLSIADPPDALALAIFSFNASLVILVAHFARRAIEKANDELELRVQERTIELQQAQEKVVVQSRVLESFFSSTINPLVLLDRDFNFIRVNKAFARAFKREIEGFPGRNYFELYPNEEREAIFRKAVETKAPYQATAKPFIFPDHPEWGTTCWNWTLTPLLNQAGEVESLVFSLRDVTQQQRVEQELRQSQKMEAIGTLAGGMAHEFNNMLAIILGNAELALDDLEEKDRASGNVEQIVRASQRARDLIGQILAFSRKTERERRKLRLTPLLKETYKLLRGTLPTTIRMELDVRTKSDTVLADPSQIQQVLINLATNATHAMQKDGGVLTISLADVAVKQQGQIPDAELAPGAYVKLSVRDTGTGMTGNVRKKLFEPFFTTKGPGEGTGMGLAVVYGIIKNHGGAITVESEPGKGSTFSLFLPLTAGDEDIRREEGGEIPCGDERILLVDDEPAVLQAASQILQKLGYKVTVAESGTEAWKIFREEPHGFDLVITDHVMPHLTGRALAEKVLNVRHDLPIILLTGYSETISTEEANAAGIRAFLMKPLTRREIAITIRNVLGRESEGGQRQSLSLVKPTRGFEPRT